MVKTSRWLVLLTRFYDESNACADSYINIEPNWHCISPFRRQASVRLNKAIMSWLRPTLADRVKSNLAKRNLNGVSGNHGQGNGRRS